MILTDLQWSNVSSSKCDNVLWRVVGNCGELRGVAEYCGELCRSCRKLCRVVGRVESCG